MMRKITLGCLAAGFAVCPVSSFAEPPKPYTGPEASGDPALFGSWSFDVTSLARSEIAIGPVTNSVTVCLKHGAKPADLPLMAKPLQGRCVMQRLELLPAYMTMLMLCEDFERRTHLTLHLLPAKDKTYAGDLSFTMTLDDDGSGTMHAIAEVFARRLGDC